MAKITKYGSEAREGLSSGIRKLAKVVGVTMGPRGRNVILGRSVGAPVATKDGVSVAREFNSEDPIEELGIQLVKEVSGRTADVAGDGTTTATVLADEIISLGMKVIDTANSIQFKSGMEFAVGEIEKIIDNKFVKQVSSHEDIKNIAIISTNNDIEFGSIIAEAFEIAGADGAVTAEAAPGVKTYVSKTDSVELQAGAINSGFFSAGEDKVTLEKCAILICDRTISHISDNTELFNRISAYNMPVLVIAKDIEKEALALFLQNNAAGRLSVCGVKLPTMGIHQSFWIEDLAMLCGAHIVSEERGIPMSNVDLPHLGFAEKVIVTRHSTRIFAPRFNPDAIRGRIASYNEDLQKLIPESERIDTKNRIGFLSRKAAKISVGYTTELELREKGDRLDDAIAAVKCAIKDGVVPGGGMTLLKSAALFREKILPTLQSKHPDFITGASVVLDACMRPCRQILLNGCEDDNAVISNCLKSEDKNYGYDSLTSTYCDLFERGIIDPAGVTKSALKNAVSIASIILTTEAIMAENPQNPSSWQPNAGYRLPKDGGLNHKR
jgi:chaperonin GroEL